MNRTVKVSVVVVTRTVMQWGAIVLCGGQSMRMGHAKAWLPIGATTLLQRVVYIVEQVANPVVVVAAPDQAVPVLPASVRIVRDSIVGRGPLQGLAAGLEALEERVDSAYVSSCDVPLLTPEFVRRVLTFTASTEIAIPFIGGFRHPLSAAYRLSVLPHVRAMLAENRLRLLDLLERVPARDLTADELPDLDSVRNVNTPEEYAALVRELSTSAGHTIS